MGHHDHPCRTGWQALRIGILGVVDRVIPLLSIRGQNHLLTRQGVLRKVSTAASKPNASQIRVLRGRLSYSSVPPGAHIWRRLTRRSPTLWRTSALWGSPATLCGSGRGRQDQETQRGRCRNDRIRETTSHFEFPEVMRPAFRNLAISWYVLRTRAAIVRRATKDPFTAWQRDCSAIHVVRSVLGLEAVHRDRVSRLQRILSPTLSAKAVRG